MEFETSNVIYAFLLTLGAGLATGIGSIMALLMGKTNKKFLSVALGFSAGVMIYISFTELLSLSEEKLSEALGDTMGTWMMMAGFFGGIAIIGLIDYLVPKEENPHEIHLIEEIYPGYDAETCPTAMDNPIIEPEMAMQSSGETSVTPKESRKLMRLGLMSALAIGIHNFPEGLATFVAALEDAQLGASIAFAIAIHNIPEGIAVSVPIYFATKSRLKAFNYSFLSGLAEPIGALIGFLILMPFMTPVTFGLLFAIIAGIMVYISLDELLPAAREYGEHHLSIVGLIAGMAIMAISLAMGA